ncbi:hypothetical protein K456DRAFT_131932 [Colletotrichum gloeosporioides 23]|nr:hypothetical protein K456DRAFT_131932 [Colletotrichum gloeosporioides 23]
MLRYQKRNWAAACLPQRPATATGASDFLVLVLLLGRCSIRSAGSLGTWEICKFKHEREVACTLQLRFLSLLGSSHCHSLSLSTRTAGQAPSRAPWLFRKGCQGLWLAGTWRATGRSQGRDSGTSPL